MRFLDSSSNFEIKGKTSPALALAFVSWKGLFRHHFSEATAHGSTSLLTWGDRFGAVKPLLAFTDTSLPFSGISKRIRAGCLHAPIWSKAVEQKFSVEKGKLAQRGAPACPGPLCSLACRSFSVFGLVMFYVWPVCYVEPLLHDAGALCTCTRVCVRRGMVWKEKG